MFDDIYGFISMVLFFAIALASVVAGIRSIIKKWADLTCTCCANVRRDRKIGAAYVLERGQRPMSFFGECDPCMKCKRHQPPEPDENRYTTGEESTPYR